MPPPLYTHLLSLSQKHASPSSLTEILAIRAPDAIHAWGHTYLVSRNPKLGDRMDNTAFEEHRWSTGPYLVPNCSAKVHSIIADEYQRSSVVNMSYFLRAEGSDEVVEQDLIWMLKFTDDEDADKVLIKESVEFIDAAASSRVGEIIRGIHGEVGEKVRGGITLNGY